MSSKSFGKLVTDLAPMEEALSTYAVRACEKLRKQKVKLKVFMFLLKLIIFANMIHNIEMEL